MGLPTGINLPGEKSGLIPDRKWKLDVKKKVWRPGETIIAGIGQGYFLTTSAQLSLALAQIVNGGNKLNPSIIVNQNDTNSKIKYDTRIIAKQSHLEFVKQSLNDATNTAGGTSYRSRIMGDLKMGGKTGTSQVRRITERDRELDLDQSQIEYKNRDHALYIAFAPYNNPRYSISVLIEHGGSGSKAAAPLASKLIKKIIDRHKKREQTRKANITLA